MPALATPLSFGEYLAHFHKDFRRKERTLWAGVYLAGLLSGVGRKTIEGIARHAPLPDGHPVEDARQALQNFLHESPWDEQLVLRRYRHWLRRALPGEVEFVVEDVSILKQGNHSVGVQRQLSSELGRKVNCQVIPTVFVTRGGLRVPVAMRLYLPRNWQADPTRLDRCRVPDDARAPASKAQVALRLVDELTAEGFRPAPLAISPSYQQSAEFADGLRVRGIRTVDEPAPDGSRNAFNRDRGRFGLDHFEGRSWRGLHHHLCMVMLAHGYHAVTSAADA